MQPYSGFGGGQWLYSARKQARDHARQNIPCPSGGEPWRGARALRRMDRSAPIRGRNHCLRPFEQHRAACPRSSLPRDIDL